MRIDILLEGNDCCVLVHDAGYLGKNVPTKESAAYSIRVQERMYCITSFLSLLTWRMGPNFEANRNKHFFSISVDKNRLVSFTSAFDFDRGHPVVLLQC